MKVKMLRNQSGCADGITQRLYLEGNEYDLPSRLSKNFLEIKAAEAVHERMIRRAPIDMDMGEAPEVKSDMPADISINVSNIDSMSVKERGELRKLILRMPREMLEKFIADNELAIPVKSTWREETIATRIIEALGV